MIHIYMSERRNVQGNKSKKKKIQKKKKEQGENIYT